MLKPIHICWQHIFYPDHNNKNNTNMAGYLIDHLPYLIAYTKLISLELNKCRAFEIELNELPNCVAAWEMLVTGKSLR